MPKPETKQPKILYEAPPEIMQIILDEQVEIKKRTKRNQVSLSAAITSCIKKCNE